jgi:hypothetical protein
VTTDAEKPSLREIAQAHAQPVAQQDAGVQQTGLDASAKYGLLPHALVSATVR